MDSFDDSLEKLRTLTAQYKSADADAQRNTARDEIAGIARSMQFSVPREQIRDIGRLLDARDLLKEAGSAITYGSYGPITEHLPAMGVISKTIDLLKEDILVAAGQLKERSGGRSAR